MELTTTYMCVCVVTGTFNWTVCDHNNNCICNPINENEREKCLPSFFTQDICDEMILTFFKEFPNTVTLRPALTNREVVRTEHKDRGSMVEVELFSDDEDAFHVPEEIVKPGKHPLVERNFFSFSEVNQDREEEYEEEEDQWAEEDWGDMGDDWFGTFDEPNEDWSRMTSIDDTLRWIEEGVPTSEADPDLPPPPQEERPEASELNQKQENRGAEALRVNLTAPDVPTPQGDYTEEASLGFLRRMAETMWAEYRMSAVCILLIGIFGVLSSCCCLCCFVGCCYCLCRAESNKRRRQRGSRSRRTGKRRRSSDLEGERRHSTEERREKRGIYSTLTGYYSTVEDESNYLKSRVANMLKPSTPATDNLTLTAFKDTGTTPRRSQHTETPPPPPPPPPALPYKQPDLALPTQQKRFTGPKFNLDRLFM